mgnify:CR=1 FL=1
MMEKRKTQLLKVSENGRYLIKEDGTPFFWLGDTDWLLFRNLSREEADELLENRAERYFNVLQAVAFTRGCNYYGKEPFLPDESGEYDPTKPDLTSEYSYWDHIDYIIDKADSLGLYIGFLPTWGDRFNPKWDKGPIIFNGENARIYGRWLGQRYKDRNNIIWILGGDRPLEEEAHYEVIRCMAQGIREGDEGRHLITFHPPGCNSSGNFLHNEEWLDFNMVQSSHSFDIANYKWVTDDYNRRPIKPVLDGEPRYEDHPIDFKPENGYFNDIDTRQAAYWAVFAGACGHTYGHHSIWSMNTKPGECFTMHWRDAMLRPGGAQMQYVRKLIESRPFLERVPDQSLVVDPLSGFDYIMATRGEDFIFVYTPTGSELEVNMGKISGQKVKAYWFDPRTGEASFFGEFENKGTMRFTPPSSGRGNDWVLVLDDSSKDFPKPGSKALV